MNPSPTLRIGIDGEGLRKPLSGIGHYVFNLCRELDAAWPQAHFFVYGRLPADQLALPSARWTLRQEPRPALRRIPSFFWLKTRGAAMCRQDGLDVFWAGRALHPGRGAAKRIVSTVHDLNHLLVPETMEAPTLWSHRLFFGRDVKTADVVLANSRGTSNRLARHLGRRADAIVYPGVRENFNPAAQQCWPQAEAALAALSVVRPYFLAVSTLEPRKNMGQLVEAFASAKAQGALAHHRLVLAGARGWQNAALGERVTALKAQGVVMPGYIADELMPALYAGADTLVMPSLYEGYGMPVAEAVAVGTPVITSDVPELEEASAGLATVVRSEAELKAALLAHVGAPRLSSTPHLSWRSQAQTLMNALDPESRS